MKPLMAVTGKHGQVSRALQLLGAGSGFRVTALGRPELDLLDPRSVREALDLTRPDIIVNAAAYTAVDRAELEPEICRAVNAQGAACIAQAAHGLNCLLMHLSTDYVFDGQGSRPYREEDAIAPIGVYGRTKAEAEDLIAQSGAPHVIVRASWVHAPWGSNFVRTMLRLAGERQDVRVVCDQRGAPTSALSIAQAVLAMAANHLAAPGDRDLQGVFHLANGGETSWAGLAEEVFRISAAGGGPAANVIPIASAEYPTAARRPAYSVLDTSKIARLHGVTLPQWREMIAPSVEGTLMEIKASGALA